MEMRRPISRTTALLAVALFATLSAVARAQPLADGSTATIGRGANGYPCPATKANYFALDRALVKHRKYAKLSAMQDGIFLEIGERVRAIEHGGPAASIVHLGILSGTDAGKTCWMPTDVEEAFVNVRRPPLGHADR